MTKFQEDRSNFLSIAYLFLNISYVSHMQKKNKNSYRATLLFAIGLYLLS